MDKIVPQKRFEFETVIKDQTNICNMDNEKKRIMELIHDGKKVLFFGRRNTGKTSLIEAYIIPEWLKKNKKGMCISVDLYGVRNIEHISERIAKAFSEAFSRTLKARSMIQSALELLATLRPKISMDESGRPQLEIDSGSGKAPHFKEIFQKINEIHRKGVPALIIMDEFQDIAGIAEAEGKLRDSMQRLESSVPIIILGSKKHMLIKIFSVPNAPFYNWGESVEVSEIDYRKYTSFMLERGLNITIESSTHLQDKMKRIPEPINIVCHHLLKKYGKNKKITVQMIDETISEIVHDRRGRPMEYLSSLTAAKARFIEVLAIHGSIKKITGKEIQKESGLSSPGILKTVCFFEDSGIIYKGTNGYQLSDPFLELHLRKFGI